MEEHVHVVGAFEAKTHLAELLRRTEGGEEFIIQRRGRPVARLVPFARDAARPSLAEIVAEMNALRAAIPRKVSIKRLIEEGRRR